MDLEIVRNSSEDEDPGETMIKIIERAEALLASLPNQRAKEAAINQRVCGIRKESTVPSNVNTSGPSGSSKPKRRPIETVHDDDCIIVEPEPDVEPKKAAKLAAASSVSQSMSPTPPSVAPPGVSDGITCPICFENVFQMQAASTICGHLYCYQCIAMEIEVRPKCPICSRPLQAPDIIQLFRN
ncbi:E3 ubiquitin-protein ligase NEURL1B-like [Armigeres subalbatus]|uniref:E3 ubiquitin-protein ligase NEURL1B-like n=1 Tax=Armigeres subalbatus TaxID=124917 RepID=UPI002ED274B0